MTELPRTESEIMLLVLERSGRNQALVVQLLREAHPDADRQQRMRLLKEYHELVRAWVEQIQVLYPGLVRTRSRVYYIGDLQLCHSGA